MFAIFSWDKVVEIAVPFLDIEVGVALLNFKLSNFIVPTQDNILRKFDVVVTGSVFWAVVHGIVAGQGQVKHDDDDDDDDRRLFNIDQRGVGGSMLGWGRT